MANQQEVIQEQREAIKGQQEAHQELMKKLSALEAEVNSLRQSATDGRLARLAN